VIIRSPIALGFSITGWPFILISRGAADKEATIAHEMVHYGRQRWVTPCWWLRWALCRRFRFDEEVLAYRAEIAFLKGRGDYVGPETYDHYARKISGKSSWWAGSYADALKELKDED
jgi:hypothetical protein